jgi:hypothetical protein
LPTWLLLGYVSIVLGIHAFDVIRIDVFTITHHRISRRSRSLTSSGCIAVAIKISIAYIRTSRVVGSAFFPSGGCARLQTYACFMRQAWRSMQIASAIGRIARPQCVGTMPLFELTVTPSRKVIRVKGAACHIASENMFYPIIG